MLTHILISGEDYREEIKKPNSGDFEQFIENRQVRGPSQAMLPALEAILGHRSAHSLATGPVMAEPAGTRAERQVSQT